MSFDTTDKDGVTRSHQFTKSMYRQVYPAISPDNPQNSAVGKNVLVTGATRGIGKAIALSWAKAGATSIVITGRAKDLLNEVSADIQKISSSIKVLALTANAGSENDTKLLWSRVKDEIGVIDVLICNAGANSESNIFPLIGTRDPIQWWSDLQVNIYGTYLHTHYYLRQYLDKNEDPEGTIIILSSGIGAFTMPGNSAYTISKHANFRQAEFLHAEYPKIRAFAVHPGMVFTQMAHKGLKDLSIDPPELTGALTLYLSTRRADYLSGNYVAVNWDVEEMEKHAREIQEKRLLSSAFVNGKLGPEGHPWES